MSLHYEWLEAALTGVEYVEPVGAEDEVDPEAEVVTEVGALVLSADDVVVIEGTPRQLRRLLYRALATLPSVRPVAPPPPAPKEE